MHLKTDKKNGVEERKKKKKKRGIGNEVAVTWSEMTTELTRKRDEKMVGQLTRELLRKWGQGGLRGKDAVAEDQTTEKLQGLPQLTLPSSR